MKLCLNRATLALDTPAAEVVRAAHAAGFLFVEMSARRLLEAVSSDAHVADLVSSRAIIPVHGGWSIRLHWNRDRFYQALPHVAAEMEAVAQLGSRSGALVLPRKPDNVEISLPSREQLIARIAEVADLAASRDLAVMIEFNGLRPFDPPDCGLRTLEQTIALCADVGRTNVGVLLDSYHWHASGGTTRQVADIPVDAPIFVHLNDAPEIERDLLEDSMRRLPGQGCIDLPALLGALHGRGYRGPLSVELKNKELHARPPHEAARLAYQAADWVLRRLRLSGESAGGGGR